jgi:DNA helicase-2/ATP-dependent DNA helicase PcrA
MSKHIIEGLNEKQKEAVLHKGGPLLVLAGAGSGKTRVITHRFAHLASKSSPNSILAVTFTNKAANEMRERICSLIRKDLRGSWIGTFHSQCNKVLRKEINALGYTGDFSIYDTDDQSNLIRHILKEFKICEALYKGILSRVSTLKASCVTPEEFLSNGDGFGFEERLARVYVRYQDELKRCNAVDFDDLIMLTTRLFEEKPDTLRKYQQKFKHILVDEFQDTNPSQYRLLKLLSVSHNNISVVGDDDQSIYGFRGANVENILTFDKDFKKAKIITLEQNYRSTKNILNVSGSVINENPKRREKTLWGDREGGEPVSHCWFGAEAEEAKYIAKLIKEFYLKGAYDYGDFALLYRINLQSRVLEDAMRYEKLPYRVIGGISFYHRKEIKDMTAYMRIALNKDDNVSLRRVINTPPRGIGASTLSKIEQKAKKNNTSLFTALKNLIRANNITSSIKEKLEGFTGIVEEISSGRYKDSADMLRTIYIKTGYSEFADDDRAENAKEFIDSAEGRDIKEFSASLSLVSGDDESGRENAVSLLTLHSAKGLEFPVVFITGLEEGVLPYFKAETPKEVSEERRLFYVGMTRAKDLLCLTGAKKRRLYAKIQEQEPSRFLLNMPSESCCRVDKTSREKKKVQAKGRVCRGLEGKAPQMGRRCGSGLLRRRRRTEDNGELSRHRRQETRP